MAENAFSDTALEVSEFVALLNQTVTYAYPTVIIRGEVANFKISKNRWVYFDLKDETARVRFFGGVYQLGSPLEDGMLVRVKGIPQLHPQYGFSVTVVSIKPEGEGAIRRAAGLLEAKLRAEGLFDTARKRTLPYPPARLGLITSTESAAYADFIKILGVRWRGMVIECVDVQVQGEAAPEQIARAFTYFNETARPPEVVVLIRGGGSAEDLYAFQTEQVTRAVATCRVPTMVAIGHEIDTSLAELAADQQASTPSNAAELLVPHREEVRHLLGEMLGRLQGAAIASVEANKRALLHYGKEMGQTLQHQIEGTRAQLAAYSQLLSALNPKSIMQRGFAIVRLKDKTLVRYTTDARTGDIVQIEVSDGTMDAAIR